MPVEPPRQGYHGRAGPQREGKTRGGKNCALRVLHLGPSDPAGFCVRAITLGSKVAGTSAALLGGEVYHYHTKLMMKEPFTGGAFVWHQDYVGLSCFVVPSCLATAYALVAHTPRPLAASFLHRATGTKTPACSRTC